MAYACSSQAASALVWCVLTEAYVPRLFCAVLQLLASEALSAARVAAEDLAPSSTTSSRLCMQLAAALLDTASARMLQQRAAQPGPEGGASGMHPEAAGADTDPNAAQVRT